MKAPDFILCRSTSTANRFEFNGHVTIAGVLYPIEANVSEYDKGDGTKGKRFEGRVHAGQDIATQLLRGSKVEGKLPRDIQDLVDKANADTEVMPFDDPLPDVMG